MKVYWVCGPDGDKWFFRETKKKAQEEVDFRNKPWYVEEEDIPDEKMGWCINEERAMAGWVPECSVGTIRKMRDNVLMSEDSGNCDTCPYFRTSAVT
jgi:hypothetical protein